MALPIIKRLLPPPARHRALMAVAASGLLYILLATLILPALMPPSTIAAWPTCPYKLTVVSVEEGWGSVDLQPQPNSKGEYADKTQVTLTAVPAPGHVFDRWEGPVTASGNTATVVMNSDKQVTAFFAPSDARFVINVNRSPSQGGSVSLSPRPPDDGYPVNTLVTVTAYAASGYAFHRWQGAVVGASPQASIVMNSDKSITAVFHPTIVTVCDPPTGGDVDLYPPQGLAGYSPGTPVTVTATAADGYRFDHWSGDISGTGNTVTLTMDGPKTVTAHFVQKDSSFPWLWIVGVSLAILLAAFIVIRLVRLARARSEY